jgi:ATP phosphoribosyltransferase regulatory subunit
MRTWALPEHIEDVLPADARKLEHLRRVVIDLFASHGYELVEPPLLEYVDSLLSGTGHDLDLATFKLVDQLSGRMMGLRADTTPQVARIDAHILNRQGVSRLCYAGSVLHTLPTGLGKSRQPFQAGAELYGHAGLQADLEVQQLMIDALRACGLADLHLDIGHPAIFRALMNECDIQGALAEEIFVAMSGKDIPELEKLIVPRGSASQALLALPTLCGGADALRRAESILPGTPPIAEALGQLCTIFQHFSSQGVAVSIDLGELGGFNYESGIVFSAFTPGSADAVARGGRYDQVGKAFGRARPATGFSMDLKAILPLVHDSAAVRCVLAPERPDAAARQLMSQLRAAGNVVVARLPGHDEHIAELNCDRELKFINGGWAVVPL